MTVTANDLTAFEQGWTDWRDEYRRGLTSEHGVLSWSGIHWLAEEPQRFEHVPGVWSSTSSGVSVELEEGDQLVLEGEPLRGRHDFGSIAERAAVYATCGDAIIEVTKQAGADLVRPHRPDNPARRNFGGTNHYAPNPAWCLDAQFIASDAPGQVRVGAVLDGLEHAYDALGVIAFELDGQPLRLTAFSAGDISPKHKAAGTMLVLFKDATSGVTTYAANRAVFVEAPDDNGSVVLDFNRATNLPCAYTDSAVCPLPPPENVLAIAVEAGEMIPPGSRP